MNAALMSRFRQPLNLLSYKRRGKPIASFNELILPYNLFIRLYRFRRYKTSPHAPLHLPLNECRVALIGSAGVRLEGQPPFDSPTKGGDCSYREFPNTLDTQSLAAAAQPYGYDKDAPETDINLVFPMDRFRELERDGTIGCLNYRHFSFGTSIVEPRPLINETAPEVAQLLKADRVDVVFLIPN